MIETSSGTRLTGEEAPLHSELEQWLKDHPGYDAMRGASCCCVDYGCCLMAYRLQV